MNKVARCTRKAASSHRPRVPCPTCVAVERAVRRGVRHERLDGLAHRMQRPGGAPRVLKDVQADLAGLQDYIIHKEIGAEQR